MKSQYHYPFGHLHEPLSSTPWYLRLPPKLSTETSKQTTLLVVLMLTVSRGDLRGIKKSDVFNSIPGIQGLIN